MLPRLLMRIGRAVVALAAALQGKNSDHGQSFLLGVKVSKTRIELEEVMIAFAS